MKNPAEETTVRPNQNQKPNQRKLNQPNPVSQLILFEKEPQLFPHQNHCNLTTTIQPNSKTGSPFFGNQLVKIAMQKPGHQEAGR